MLHLLLCIAAWICCVGTISLAAASSSPDVDAFHTWISDGGGTLQGVRVGETKNMGRGVLATTALSEGDRILSMPLSLVLCRATILAALDGDRQVKKMLAAVEDEEGEPEEWVWSGPAKAVRRTHRYACEDPKTMEELSKMSSLELCRYTPTPRYLLPPIPRYHDWNSRAITSGLTDDTKDTTGDTKTTAAGGGGGATDNDDATRAAKRRRTD